MIACLVTSNSKIKIQSSDSKNIKEITKVDLDSCESFYGMGIYRATIEMKLPIEASDDDGILTKNGTMIYGKEDDAVTIGVQPLKDETGNVSFEGVRTLITINESTASKEYTFAYDLPEGYSLITAKDYYCDIIDNEAVNENDYDTGEVYIVNKDNVIDTVIAAAKVAKVVKYIKTLGGVKKAAKLVVLAYAAGDAKKYARHIGGSFKNLCEIILGIDTIKSQCKF